MGNENDHPDCHTVQNYATVTGGPSASSNHFIGLEFLLTLCKFCIQLRCQALHTRSANESHQTLQNGTT